MKFVRGQDIKVALDIGARKDSIKLGDDPSLDMTFVLTRGQYELKSAYQKRIEHFHNIRGMFELLAGKETTATYKKITGHTRIDHPRTLILKEHYTKHDNFLYGIKYTIDLEKQEEDIVIMYRDILYLIKGKLVNKQAF
jgi:hypothetical protein